MLIAGISKKVQREKYYITYVVMKYSKLYNTNVAWKMGKNQNVTSQMHEVDEYMDNRLEYMICDIE